MVLETENSSNNSHSINNTIKKRYPSEPTRIQRYGDISSVSSNEVLSALDALKVTTNLDLSELKEALIQWSQNEIGLDEFITAQSEFQALTGRVFYDDSCYHQRITYFLDYFVFQRPVSKNNQIITPYSSFLQSPFYLGGSNMTQGNKENLENLQNFQHSIYMCKKVNDRKIILKDLIHKTKNEVFTHEDHSFNGFPSKSIVQGFIFELNHRKLISSGIIIHPPGSASFIKKYIKKTLKEDPHNKMKILTQLARKNLDLLRHRNIDVRKIYSSLQ